MRSWRGEHISIQSQQQDALYKLLQYSTAVPHLLAEKRSIPGHSREEFELSSSSPRLTAHSQNSLWVAQSTLHVVSGAPASAVDKIISKNGRSLKVWGVNRGKKQRSFLVRHAFIARPQNAVNRASSESPENKSTKGTVLVSVLL